MLRIQGKFSNIITKNIKSNGVMKFLKINAIKQKKEEMRKSSIKSGTDEKHKIRK